MFVPIIIHFYSFSPSSSSSSSSFAIQQNFLRLLSLKNKNHISRFILFHSLFVWRRTNLWFNKSFAFFLSFSQFIKFVFLCLWIDEKQIKIFFFIYWSIRISFLWTIPSIIRLSLINKQHTLHFFSSPSFLLSLSHREYCENTANESTKWHRCHDNRRGKTSRPIPVIYSSSQLIIPICTREKTSRS